MLSISIVVFIVTLAQINKSLGYLLQNNLALALKGLKINNPLIVREILFTDLTAVSSLVLIVIVSATYDELGRL